MTSRLIVLERDGHWAAALRQELDRSAVGISETRSWDETWQLVAKSLSALVAAELWAEKPDRMLAAIARVERRHPQAAIIVLADRRLADYRDLLLEAGALHFITSPRRLHEIRRILERRAERFGGNTITENPLEKIRSDLPWNEQGVGDLELGTGDASSSSAAD